MDSGRCVLALTELSMHDAEDTANIGQGRCEGATREVGGWLEVAALSKIREVFPEEEELWQAARERRL